MHRPNALVYPFVSYLVLLLLCARFGIYMCVYTNMCPAFHLSLPSLSCHVPACHSERAPRTQPLSVWGVFTRSALHDGGRGGDLGGMQVTCGVLVFNACLTYFTASSVKQVQHAASLRYP